MSTVDVATMYQAFGMAIRSEIELPLPAADALALPAWRIVRGETPAAAQGALIAENRCDEPCHNGQVITQTYRGDAGTWVWSRDTGLYHISIDDRLVTVYADHDADERAIGLVLIGQVAVYMLHRLGYPSLHASAVLVDGEAVAFVAPAGSGKSTMAGSFLRNGATLVSDDVLPLLERVDGIYAMPGAPMMKVWDGTATETFGIQAALPDLTNRSTKKLLSVAGRFDFTSEPVKLRAIYLLQRYAPQVIGDTRVRIRRISQGQAFPLLLAQSPRRDMLFPREAARLLPLYAKLTRQASVRTLSVPNGFGYQDEVREHILADLGSRE